MSGNYSMTGKKLNFKIKATAEMAPKSRIIVYAIRPSNKEILVDALDFRVKGLFVNNVIHANLKVCY